MSEQLTGQTRIMRGFVGVPPGAAYIETASITRFPSSRLESFLTIPPVEPGSVASWNRETVRRMWDYQKATDTGCFFASLCGLSAAIRPETVLPGADEFLAVIRPMYGEVLEREKLLVEHRKLADALAIYEEWGMRVNHITRNMKAQQLLGESLKAFDEQGIVKDTLKSDFLKMEDFKPPFVVWMHEGITNQAHFVTVDGTQEAFEMAKDYEQNRKYFIKMVIEAGRSGKTV